MKVGRPSDSGAMPAYTIGEEIAHTLTHGVGLVASLGGCAVLLAAAQLRGDARHLVGCAVFGAALVALYAASTLYHGVRHGPVKRVFRQLDHAAVFLLIAGTYTPFALLALSGAWRWTLLVLVWVLALLGIGLQLMRPAWSRRLSVPLHLLMGWMAVVALEPLVRALDPSGLVLLVLGGLAYTLGVIFYAWRRLPYNHAVWHLFVLAGSACHFSCVLGHLLPPAA